MATYRSFRAGQDVEEEIISGVMVVWYDEETITDDYGGRCRVAYKHRLDPNGDPAFGLSLTCYVRPAPPQVIVELKVGDMVDVFLECCWVPGRIEHIQVPTYIVELDEVDPNQIHKILTVDKIRLSMRWCAAQWSFVIRH